MPESFELAEALMPEGIRRRLLTLGEGVKNGAEELRLRLGRPPTLLLADSERSIGGDAVTAADIAHVLDRASRSSLHAVQHELRQGFVTAAGGIRIGVCGTMAGESLRDFSSLAVRIPHHLPDAGAEAIRELRPFEHSVLIISPPGGGKTTFLRNLVRSASENGKRVCLCDERGEVAAMWQGKPSFELGPGTDVISGVGKAEGIMMLLRAMNPRIIALDEISASADMAAIEQAICCGAAIYASVHSTGVEEMKRRVAYARLLDMGIFERAVVIKNGVKRSYEVVKLC